jgi:hypothetical protein
MYMFFKNQNHQYDQNSSMYIEISKIQKLMRCISCALRYEFDTLLFSEIPMNVL